MLKIKKYLNGGQEGGGNSPLMTAEVARIGTQATPTPWMLKNRQGLMMGASVFNAMLGTPKDYEGAAGSTAMGIDGFTDAASQVASQFGPVGLYIGMGLQANKLLSNITGKITGLDGMTSTDVIMNRIPVLGLVNGLGGKRADTMQQDLYTQSQTLFGYNGTNIDINNAAMKSGKKYGMFSSGARRNANWEIASAGRKQNTLKYLIKGRDTAMDAMAGSADLYNTGYANELMGGYEPLIAAKKGAKLSVAKRVASKYKFTKAQLKKAADLQDDLDAYKNGGVFEFDISMFQKGGKSKSEYDLFLETLPENQKNTDPSIYRMQRYWELNGKPKNFDDAIKLGMFKKEQDGLYHANSVAYNKDLDEYEFMKSPNHNTIWMEEVAYNSSIPKLIDGKNDDGNPENYQVIPMEGKDKNEMDRFRQDYELIKNDENGNPLLFWKYVRRKVESHKQGGSLIPEGALHKNLNHLEEVNPDLKGEVTKKGIPIISNEEGGEIVLHAEIEEGEIIFQKSVTEKIEELYKEYNKEDISQAKKDELAIKAGKIIAKEIMEKTDDKVGLIEKTE